MRSVRPLLAFARSMTSALASALLKLVRSPAVLLVAVAVAGASVVAGARYLTVAPLSIALFCVAVYVADVARAREIVRDVVLLGWRPPTASRCVTVRAESLVALAAAFGAVRVRDAIGAEIALARVRRSDLGAWESRVFHAVRALVSVEVTDEAGAARLVALALPTGHFEVDRALARVALRAAWDDPRRLALLTDGLRRAGDHLGDLVALALLRVGELEGTLDALPSDCPNGVVEGARNLGDPRFADVLSSLAARRGVYR